jgi:hypothetical protein
MYLISKINLFSFNRRVHAWNQLKVIFYQPPKYSEYKNASNDNSVFNFAAQFFYISLIKIIKVVLKRFPFLCTSIKIKFFY